MDVGKAMSLDILIPSRNELWLSRTVEDILEHKRGDTKIIVGLDGQWSEPVIKDHPDVTIIHTSEPIGQRAMTNQCARLSKAKFVLKCDAHCSFAEGFDVEMLKAFEEVGDNVTMAPTMRNLWAFSWKCLKCGLKTYQGPTPTSCSNCDNTSDFKRKMVWIAKDNPQSNAYCFDSEPHFQYMKSFSKRPEGKGDLTETMSLQGSCFMLTRDKYWELGICDEAFGSWGSQGIEVACKTWLSGGRVMVNHKTYYAHLFRTQGLDFGFPYENPGKAVEAAKAYARHQFFDGNFDKAIRPLSWLVEKFWPVPGWTQEDLDALKGVN